VVDVHTAHRYAVLSVRDHGRWRQPGSTEPTFRGRGLPLMRASMARVEVRPSDHGTTVHMDTHTCPANVPPAPH
jgi:anti-sigma regulatory factor (Ser/Thr protein kinase)